MANNILTVPSFAETQALLEMSQSWVLDEYVGAVYVALIAAARGLQNLLGIPFQIPLYLLQLGLGLTSVHCFLGEVFKRRDTAEGEYPARACGFKPWLLWLVSAYVNTIPFLVQAHFAVLPYSLASAVYLFLATSLVRLVRRTDALGDEVLGPKVLASRVLEIVFLWSLSALVLPEYGVLAGVLVVPFVLYVGIKHTHLRGWMVIVVVLGVLCSGALQLVTTQEGSRGRMQNTLEAQAVRRLVWPDIFRISAFWGPEITENFTTEELMEISMAPERMIDVFGPRLEGIYGVERANELYVDMAKTALSINTKAVAKQLAMDMGAYFCPQVAIGLETRGIGGTYTGWNYEKLQAQNIVVTNLYVEWGLLGFAVLLFLAIFRMSWYVKNNLGLLGWAFICLFLQAGCYMWTTGGMVSYLKCPVNLAIWGMLVTVWLLASIEEE